MAIIRDLAIVFLVISCIGATVAEQEDGLPRPFNVSNEPTTSYGANPEVLFPDGSLVDCTWYGFANELYDASVGLTCLSDLRLRLLHARETLAPFVYYFFTGATGTDPASNDPFCLQGCFNLNSGAQPPDSGAFPPSYFDGAPAPAPDPYLRGPSPAPFYWPGTPPSADFAPPPTSGA